MNKCPYNNSTLIILQANSIINDPTKLPPSDSFSQPIYPRGKSENALRSLSNRYWILDFLFLGFSLFIKIPYVTIQYNLVTIQILLQRFFETSWIFLRIFVLPHYHVLEKLYFFFWRLLQFRFFCQCLNFRSLRLNISVTFSINFVSNIADISIPLLWTTI